MSNDKVRTWPRTGVVSLARFDQVEAENRALREQVAALEQERDDALRRLNVALTAANQRADRAEARIKAVLSLIRDGTHTAAYDLANDIHDALNQE